MKQVIQLDSVPEKCLVLNGFGKTDYQDVYRISRKTSESVDDITTKIFSASGWSDSLMKLRDALVGAFGLKTSKAEKKYISPLYKVGEKAVLFTVVDRNENEIVMAENDKHLNFRTAVYIERGEANTHIYLSTLVKFNNIWGKLYFLPVKPFHKLIIKSLLKSL
jgi:hypothetical protein